MLQQPRGGGSMANRASSTHSESGREREKRRYRGDWAGIIYHNVSDTIRMRVFEFCTDDINNVVIFTDRRRYWQGVVIVLTMNNIILLLAHIFSGASHRLCMRNSAASKPGRARSGDVNPKGGAGGVGVASFANRRRIEGVGLTL